MVTCTAWQIYISVITHGERDPYSCGSSFYIKVASIFNSEGGSLICTSARKYVTQLEQNDGGDAHSPYR